MSRRAPLAFWYDFASPYSWMAASRVEQLAADAGRTVEWQPFLLGPIFAALRPDGQPFQPQSDAERTYRRIDIARCCAELGLAWAEPTVYPRSGLLGARAVLAVKRARGDVAGVSLALYRANFVQDRDITDAAVVEEVLAELGLDGGAILADATSTEGKQALRDQGAAALAAGLFGAPTLVVDGELFWGNDRLEQAMRKAAA